MKKVIRGFLFTIMVFFVFSVNCFEAKAGGKHPIDNIEVDFPLDGVIGMTSGDACGYIVSQLNISCEAYIDPHEAECCFAPDDSGETGYENDHIVEDGDYFVIIFYLTANEGYYFSSDTETGADRHPKSFVVNEKDFSSTSNLCKADRSVGVDSSPLEMVKLEFFGTFPVTVGNSGPAPEGGGHASHAAKANPVPVKNSDGSYSIGFDGMPVIVCSVCGQVHKDIPMAQKLWEDEIAKAVKEHKNFDTSWRKKNEAEENPVTIASDTFVSFDKATLEKLRELGEALILKFKYNGKYYVTTIPAGSDFASLADENGWAGFAYIMSVFGGREITAEEFALD